MDFDDVQAALRDSGRDGLLAYDSAADPLAPLPNLYCRGAWNVYHVDGSTLVSRGELGRFGSRSEVWDFDDPVAAYTFQFLRAREESPAHSVRSLTSADLPPTLRDWLVGSGWQLGRDLFGNPLVAQRRGQSWRTGAAGTWIGIVFGGARTGGNLGTAVGFLTAGALMRWGGPHVVGPYEEDTTSVAVLRVATAVVDIIGVVVLIIVLVRWF